MPNNPFNDVFPILVANFDLQFLERHSFLPTQLIAKTSQVSDCGAKEHFGQRVFLDPKYVSVRKENYALTVVLDLDQTLIDTDFGTEQYKYYIRPHARNMLKEISSLKNTDGNRLVEIILWSAGTFQHVAIACGLLDPEQQIFDYVIARGEWYTKHAAKKDLTRLIGRHNTCIILDDTESMVALNNTSALLISRFTSVEFSTSSDQALHQALQVITWLANIMSVLQHYSKEHKPEDKQPCLSDLHLEIDSSAQYLFSSMANNELQFNIGDILAKHPAVKRQMNGHCSILKLSKEIQYDEKPIDKAILFELSSQRLQQHIAMHGRRPLLHIQPGRLVRHNQTTDLVSDTADSVVEDTSKYLTRNI